MTSQTWRSPYVVAGRIPMPGEPHGIVVALRESARRSPQPGVGFLRMRCPGVSRDPVEADVIDRFHLPLERQRPDLPGARRAGPGSPGGGSGAARSRRQPRHRDARQLGVQAAPGAGARPAGDPGQGDRDLPDARRDQVRPRRRARRRCRERHAADERLRLPERRTGRSGARSTASRCSCPATSRPKREPNGDILMYPCADTAAPPCARMPSAGFYFDAIVRQEPIDEAQARPRRQHRGVRSDQRR